MFHCKRCGQCCRKVDRIGALSWLDRGDGRCKYLNGNLCSIYENRPLLCRVDEAYEKFFDGLVSKDEYYRLNYEQCEKLSGAESENVRR